MYETVVDIDRIKWFDELCGLASFRKCRFDGQKMESQKDSSPLVEGTLIYLLLWSEPFF